MPSPTSKLQPSRLRPITLTLKRPGYATLLTQVKKVLIEGQARIDAERVRTYWQTGDLVNTHIAKYSGGNPTYGDEVVLHLSRDLKVGESILYRCVKFNTTYPDLQKVAAPPLFKWNHYRELMTVPDDKKRALLENSAFKNAWTSRELALRIKEKNPHPQPRNVSTPVHPSVNRKPLTPLRGTLHTYKLIERPNLANAGGSGLLVDLGFGVYHDVDGRQLSGFAKDDIVESRPKEDAYTFYKVDRAAKDLYTYAAYVEKVIDGDTVKVRLDLGFRVWARQILRLRDIDCPETGTPSGEEAKNFVRSHLKESQYIIIRSSRSDKYDRYLADIFIPQPGGGGEDIYLNNLLLQTGRAERAG